MILICRDCDTPLMGKLSDQLSEFHCRCGARYQVRVEQTAHATPEAMEKVEKERRSRRQLNGKSLTEGAKHV